jgi:hypothetical protein
LDLYGQLMATTEVKLGPWPVTLRVHRAAEGMFEIRDRTRLLGTFSSELVALWTAVEAAESLAKYGSVVQVVAVRGGEEFAEFAAVPFA